MSNFLQALSNQAISAITLLIAIIGGGTLVVYRLDALEEQDKQQSARFEQLVTEVTNIRISMAQLEAKQGAYFEKLQSKD